MAQAGESPGVLLLRKQLRGADLGWVVRHGFACLRLGSPQHVSCLLLNLLGYSNRLAKPFTPPPGFALQS